MNMYRKYLLCQNTIILVFSGFQKIRTIYCNCVHKSTNKIVNGEWNQNLKVDITCPTLVRSQILLLC